MQSLTFTHDAVGVSPTSLLSLGSPRLPLAASHRLNSYLGHVCISLQRPIYPILHTKGRNSSWVLPCSSCSIHCLHLLFLETLNVTPVHSGTQRQLAKESPAFQPLPGGHCNAATVPAALSQHWYRTRWQLRRCPFYPPQHGSLGGKTPARDHHVFHTQNNQQQVFEHQ